MGTVVEPDGFYQGHQTDTINFTGVALKLTASSYYIALMPA